MLKNSDETDENKAWRVSKIINVGDILAALGIAITVIGFVWAGYTYNNQLIQIVSEKVAVQQSQIAQLQANMDRDRADNKAQFVEILTEIRLLRSDIKDKADK